MTDRTPLSELPIMSDVQCHFHWGALGWERRHFSNLMSARLRLSTALKRADACVANSSARARVSLSSLL
jgi:hypothetical protein